MIPTEWSCLYNTHALCALTGYGVVLPPAISRVPVDSLLDEALVLWVDHTDVAAMYNVHVRTSRCDHSMAMHTTQMAVQRFMWAVHGHSLPL